MKTKPHPQPAQTAGVRKPTSGLAALLTARKATQTTPAALTEDDVRRIAREEIAAARRGPGRPRKDKTQDSAP